MKLKIGFIILTWNSENVISLCLDSIYNLNIVEPYVIVIDNGSSDNTRKVLEQYKKSIKIIYEKKNLGTTKTRNIGLKYFQRFNLDYYCILDSDTKVNDQAFQIMHREMISNSKYGICGPKMKSSKGIIQKSARPFPTLLEKLCKACPIKKIEMIGEKMENVYQGISLSSFQVDYLMSACWLIRPSVINKIGMFDEKIFYAPEDAEFCIRVWKNGFQVAFCPEAEIIHEWQRLSKRKLISKMNYEHIKGLIYMFYKHKYLFSTKNLKSEIQGDQL